MHRHLLLIILLIPVLSFSQALPSIDDKTKGMRKQEGLIDFYWEESSGKLWLKIDKLDTELLYVMSLPAALGSNDIGLDRGLLGDSRIISFNRSGRKLLMVQPNYAYRAITSDAAEKKAVQQSFAQSVLWGFTIEAETNGEVLVDATDFLLRDAIKAANRIRSMKQGNYSFDKSRSALYLPQSKNFPKNTELEATITLVNADGEVGNYVESVTPSTEAITVRMHHSFVQLPDNNYKPRVFDPRSGFINISYFDYSTPVTEPIEKHFIIRHRLKKKDPSAARSEAVNPIIYYLDNGTPEPIRTALLEGAKWWNQAFEAAGYINAFQMKLLPDDADPMDVRYNVINWVHRSTRGWSYGASVVDPRTGEIIKGHVSLGSLRVRQDYMIAVGLLAPFENGVPADDKMLTLALNRLKQLSAHEVGHTLGLMHNFASNRESVMDYPPPVAKLDTRGNIDISDAYGNQIGDWDKIAIAWGYQDYPNTEIEKKSMADIMDEASKKGYKYISDRDARSPGGLHPAAHLWDGGTDVIEELKTVMKVREKALSQFGENNIRVGAPMAMLEDVLVPVYLFHRYQVEAVSKIIGGMDYSYALRGDGQTITRVVPVDLQRKALEQLLLTIDPAKLVIPARILKLIPPRPAGYEYTRELFKKRTGLAFDALSPAESDVDMLMSLLFNSERMNRMRGTETLSLREMVGTVLRNTWMAERRQNMEGLIQTQTEQIILTYLLAASVNENNSYATRSIITKALDDLKLFIEQKKKTATAPDYAGHLLLALERMKKPENAKPSVHFAMPPGSPIGCGGEY